MRLFLVALVLIPILFVSKGHAEQRFFNSLYDVPIMTGLDEVPEMALSYDKGEGRIASASATYADKEISTVFRFYSQSLPQFGWKKVSDNRYLREKEQLVITREWLDDAWLVTFALEPQE